MDSCDDTRCRVGCPIRISTDQRLLAAPRGFSQRATSFIASWCQGIHRMPLSRSKSDPTSYRRTLNLPRTGTIHTQNYESEPSSAQQALFTQHTHVGPTAITIGRSLQRL